MLARRILTSKAKSSLVPAFTARSFSAPATTKEDYSSPDHYFDDEVKANAGDPSKRAFTYFVLGGSRIAYATAARLAVIKFVGSISASADVLALSTAEFSLASIEPGSTITVKWRGKPIFIKHRTEAEIAKARDVDLSQLRDPESDEVRVQDPKWLVILGICTHLGCVPTSNAGEYEGWFCPCHGSHYDLSGRIRKGPAPLNMEIPPYKFVDGDRVLLG
ncbi:hypothetical protein DYB28_001010 [Aphanomyces astaci]|uniref:Cytochrome b-c1 complex subunit Rieske, mitochondrial n=2 Tax=Aphanomyces astaci TaxID=112090 RepID=A0A397DMR1_APHAT|nr:hypothetical protein AaE_014992 [Aphanomyces astaci]RHY01869.1 hypothetical protein DYB36_011070 [Aphanomyces astaci]RHY40867.1 hypothetical protein DYB34_014220 [Aphanomyces astaci]RHY67900.1 hypothetical protein DYB30_008708 [Aphanomyces astaci]RHY94546.1 hypothetical protein DYB35_005982 [Aphanomyces astaci]